jgi:hypothetical protein
VFSCFKLETIVSYWEEYCESMQSWLLSEVWNIKTPNLYFQQRKSPEFWTTKLSKEGTWFHSFAYYKKPPEVISNLLSTTVSFVMPYTLSFTSLLAKVYIFGQQALSAGFLLWWTRLNYFMCSLAEQHAQYTWFLTDQPGRKQLPYVRHYKPRLVYFLPHFQRPFLCF